MSAGREAVWSFLAGCWLAAGRCCLSAVWLAGSRLSFSFALLFPSLLFSSLSTSLLFFSLLLCFSLASLVLLLCFFFFFLSCYFFCLFMVSALRVPPAETRLTVYRRCLHVLLDTLSGLMTLIVNCSRKFLLLRRVLVYRFFFWMSIGYRCYDSFD